jgi:hypothetical protein
MPGGEEAFTLNRKFPICYFNTSVIAAGSWGYLAVGDRTIAALFYEEASSQIDSGRTKTPFLVAHAHAVGGSI